MPRPVPRNEHQSQRGTRTTSSSPAVRSRRARRSRSPGKRGRTSPSKRRQRSRPRGTYPSPRRRANHAQVFDATRMPPTAFSGVPSYSTVSEELPHNERNTAASLRNLPGDDQSQDVLMRSSAVVLTVAFVMLLGVACVVIAHRTGGQIASSLPTRVSNYARPPIDKAAPNTVHSKNGPTEIAVKNLDPTPLGGLRNVPRNMHSALGAFLRKTHRPRSLGNGYECTTEGCSKEGERLASQMDSLLNPCDNFYEHICANWAEEHPVPKGGGHVSYRSTLVEFVEKRLDEVVREELRKILSAPLSFNVLSSQGKAILLRNACMSEERLNDRGLRPLKEALASLHLHEWPTVKIEFNVSLIEKVAAALASRLGVFPLVSVSVERDPDDSEKYVIAMDEPSREVIRRNEFFLNEHEMLEYESVVRKAFDKLSNPALSDLLGSAVLGLEDEVAQATLPKTPQEEKVRRHIKMQVNELPYCSKLRWVRFLNKTFEKIRPVTHREVVLVKNLPFLKKLVEVLEGRQRRTIINYLGFKAYTVFSLLLPPRSDGDITKYYGRILTGRHQNVPRWRLCLRMAEDAMPFAFLSMYHDMFVKDHNVLNLRSSISRMKDFLGSSVENITWLSGRDVPKALEKVKQLDFVDFFPGWVLSEEERNVFYETVQYVPVGNVLLSLVNARATHVGHRFRQLVHSLKRTSWFGSVFDIHATYDPLNNTIYVPMAMFVEPMGFDSTDTPLYVPRTLVDVANILMSIVSGYGSLFSTQDKAHEWWTTATKESYKNYSSCLATQYNKSLSMSLAGALYRDFTVEPNVRDNAALPFLYEMYKASLKDHGIRGHSLLANVPNATTEQLFFVVYATRFCENANEGYVEMHLKNVPLALPSDRVNIPLWNSFQFTDAYHCRKGSNMNPFKKCKFWKFQ
ncbi:neprilysin-2-like [Ornithodoros turicata]|uniref:neprilysin-2-like n=1 Tax=Ornithodoros turicata TaxID=34597 RepID=UPI00313A104B